LELFRRVGEPYLWFSRLMLPGDQLRGVLRDRAVEVYAVRCDGADEGLLELDFRKAGECELSYFGLTQKLVGTGTGRWLMNRAVEIAWSHPIERFWLHTCTLDHPGAVAFYLRSGFVAFKRWIEYADDPRLTG
ncbi:MAG: GNAT family N-acetyltransferase, partial [Candidatus Baltobacteraceae bacterium]